MASRVNIKFVIGLSIAIIALVVGGTLFAISAVGKSAERSLEEGDQALAAGQLDKAIGFYGRAVNKDQRNPEYLRKWIGAMEKFTPATRQAYQDMYRQYIGALRALADADRTSTPALRRYLDERLGLIQRDRPSLAIWESLAAEYEELAKNFRGDDKGKAALRRYRAIARAGMLGANPDVAVEIIDGGLEDALAALSVDPSDREALFAAASFEYAKAARARATGNTEQATQMEAAARQRLEKFAHDNPDQVRIALQLLQSDISAAARNLKGPATAGELLQPFRDRIQALIDTVKAQPADKIDTLSVIVLAQYAAGGLPSGVAVADEMLEHVGKVRPDDAVFRLAWARALLGRGQTERAMSLAQEIVALPEKPLSIDGLMLLINLRGEAIRTQADAAFGAWERATTPEERTKWAEKAKSLRQELADRVGENSTMVLSVDSRLALVQGDIGGSRTLITRYNDQTGRTDPQMLLLEGEVLTRIGSLGAARQSFARVLQLEPTNARAMIGVARVEAAQNNFKDASAYLSSASKLMPDNAALADQAARMKELADDKSTDEVVNCLKRAAAQGMGIAGDTQASIATIRKCLEAKPDEPRLTRALAQMLAADGQRDEALAIADRLLAKDANDQFALGIKRGLTASSAASVQESIDKADAPEYRKNLARYQLLMRENKPEQAREALSAAAKQAPDDPAVLEYLFNDAMMRSDKAELARIAAIAESKNLDKVNGLLYRARREVAEQRLSDAAATLREVIGKDKLNVGAWRLLGSVELERGNVQPAIDALSKAVEIKPDDVVAINAYIRALLTGGRGLDAITFARKSEKYAQGDRDFQELFLNLEAQGGGDINKVIAARKRFAERDPSNRSNKAQLASLLMSIQKFDEARPIIDELLKDPTDAGAVQLQAGYLAARGDVDGGIAFYKKFLESIPEDKRTEGPYVTASRLIWDFRRPDQAIAVLEEGRKYQNPKTALADREIGDRMFSADKLRESATAYERVVALGAEDDKLSVSKRILECYLRLKDFEAFDKRLAATGAAGQTDPTILLLAAEAANAGNDRQRAGRLYDQVVTLDPKNPIAYLKRGDFRASDPRLLKDAEADYEQMSRLEGCSTMGRTRLADIYRRTGREELAVTNLKDALACDPGNDALRFACIQSLAQLNRNDEVVALYEDAINRPQSSPEWRGRAAAYYGDQGRWDKATEHLAVLWKDYKNPSIATGYVNALLNLRKPDTATAAAVLASLSPEAAKDVGVRMIRARVLLAQGLTTDAANEVAAAYLTVDHYRPDIVASFINGLVGVYPKPADRAAALAKLEASKKFVSQMAVQAGSLRLNDPATRAAGRAGLEALINDPGTDARTKAGCCSSLGTDAYSAADFSRARDFYMKGLEFAPDSAELNNNLAYILAAKLDRGSEALQFAQKAVAIAPQNSGFLDTMGVSLIASKDCQQALAALERALAYASNDAERLPALIHSAKAKLCLREKADARRLVTMAGDLLAKNPQMGEAHAQDLKDLEQQLDAQ